MVAVARPDALPDPTSEPVPADGDSRSRASAPPASATSSTTASVRPGRRAAPATSPCSHAVKLTPAVTGVHVRILGRHAAERVLALPAAGRRRHLPVAERVLLHARQEVV